MASPGPVDDPTNTSPSGVKAGGSISPGPVDDPTNTSLFDVKAGGPASPGLIDDPTNTSPSGLKAGGSTSPGLVDDPTNTILSGVKAVGSATPLAVSTPNIATAVESGFLLPPPASTSTESTVAFAFDVDGVLVRGKGAIPGARETIRLLQDNGIPFIFLTNSGGHTEADGAATLSKNLGVDIDADQLVQSHSPFHDLVPFYGDKTILSLGGTGDNIRNVSEAYGFRNVATSSDLMVEWEHIHPFPEMTKAHHSAHGRRTASGRPQREISAILVWSSPRDWCLDMQVALDLLLSSGGIFGQKSLKAGDISLPNNGYLQDGQPKLYFSNPDFEWATPHHAPRFAQGAFREALRGVWNYATKNEARLECTSIGKPTTTTFVYGEKTLQAYNEKLARQRGRPAPAIKTVYMIGDNPESDIAGANNYESRMPGAEWRSILVETGVYRETEGEPSVRPHHQAPDVAHAVMLALEREEVELAGADRLLAALQSHTAEEEQQSAQDALLDLNALPDTFGVLMLEMTPAEEQPQESAQGTLMDLNALPDTFGPLKLIMPPKEEQPQESAQDALMEPNALLDAFGAIEPDVPPK